MSLLQTLKADLVDFRKQSAANRNDRKAAVLRDLLLTLVGELERIEKDKGSITDAEIGKRVLVYIENAKAIEKAALTPETYRSDDTAPNAGLEIDYLSNFIPKYFTESELETIVGDLMIKYNIPVEKKSLGLIMGALKREFEGKYDGAMAKTVVQKIIG